MLCDESLEELLSRVGIKNYAWDVLIVGDGSGSNWDHQAGWASVSIEKSTRERIVWTGAVNRGTVNFAELMAYLQPLEWFAGRAADRRKKNAANLTAYHVHILTDSQYSQSTGESKGRAVVKNAGLWSVFDAFSRHGFVLHWHWLRRSDCDLNKFCDRLSKAARKLHEADLTSNVLARADWASTVEEINPITE